MGKENGKGVSRNERNFDSCDSYNKYCVGCCRSYSCRVIVIETKIIIFCSVIIVNVIAEVLVQDGIYDKPNINIINKS